MQDAPSSTVEADSGERPLISIVVPVYNEQDNIPRTYKKLKEETDNLGDYKFEFIFIDNRSTDNSFMTLVDLAEEDKDLRVVRFARNFGFQKSVLTGYRLARGEAAIQIDADLQDPPAMFGPFLKKWQEGHDVVVGVRRLRKESRFLHSMRRMYYWLMARLEGEHLVQNAGDFRLIDKSLIARLRRIHEPHMYLRGMISSLSRNQVGIEYDREKREFGESKYGLLPLLALAMDGILTHSSFPLRISFYLGISIAFLAALLSAFYLVLFLVWPTQSPPGFTTTQLLILFGIGINSSFLGVVGIYVGRIYDQVRIRPLTIISDLVNFEESIEVVERSLVDEK
ncbi:glycosyltransferase family 2 protein [Parvibaculaceae bacterium PLY_AMNH_Bact1]|nr:glycosyltransferase family 2 protein [Parvibaculaceae bacterium PLY_AMNH_Bact1]